MKIDISTLQQNLQKELASVNDIDVIESIKVKYLGKKGLINNLFVKMARLPLEEKKEIGKLVNDLKVKSELLIQSKTVEIRKQSKDSDWVDVTLPGEKLPSGSLHIVSLAIEEIVSVFKKIGFIRMSYPEVEWDFFSFESLNMPSNHPARDDFETFFVKYPNHQKFGKMVLTPHTSSGQPREMLRVGTPPIRMINIAKCYRPNWDVSHVPMFHQFEGLCVDRGINITHLKGTIDYFAKQFFGEDREIRLRPFHFQFTEPSFEVDITCGVCKGTGFIPKSGFTNHKSDPPIRRVDSPCRFCKSGWVELGGTGMVHPNVLKAGGVDPSVYTGWAFGFGVERVFMMKEGLNLNDIRVLYGGDIRFLEQF